MKLTKKIRVTVLLVAACLTVAVSVFASYAYDGTADPVISLSYLRQYKQLEIDPQIADLQAKIESLQNAVDSLSGGNLPSADSGEYEVLQLFSGQTLLASAACDVMLRSGKAVVVAPTQTQGISDYTDGVELLNGDSLTINHMLLIPRGDGRGIHVTSAEAYIMVRGAYRIES